MTAKTELGIACELTALWHACVSTLMSENEGECYGDGLGGIGSEGGSGDSSAVGYEEKAVLRLSDGVV